MKGKRKWWIASAIVLLSSGAWAAWHYTRGPTLDPVIAAKMTELRQQLAPESKLAPDERRKVMDDFRKLTEQLPKEQQTLVRQQGREMMRKEMEKRVHEYFALPPDQRLAALDKAIDDQEKWRQARQQSRAQAGTGAGGPQAGGPPPQGNRGQNAGRVATPEQQIARRVNRLNSSTPEVRAYMQLMQQRRAQRGLPGYGGPRG